MIDVPRGSFMATLREMQSAFMWGSDKRVRTFLKTLENGRMIGRTSVGTKNASKTHVTICNYDEYQTVGRTKDAPKTHERTQAGRTADAVKEPYNNITKEEPKGSLSSGDDVQAAFDAYNVVALEVGWSQAKVLNKTRRSSISARLREAGGIDGWHAALAKARASPLCTGDNNRNWTADLDFLLQQKSFTRLMEGSYDARPHTTTISQFPRRGAEDGKRPDPALEKALRLSGLGEAQSNAGG